MMPGCLTNSCSKIRLGNLDIGQNSKECILMAISSVALNSLLISQTYGKFVPVKAH